MFISGLFLDAPTAKYTNSNTVTSLQTSLDSERRITQSETEEAEYFQIGISLRIVNDSLQTEHIG